jgi:outer membrane receptor for ferrienterochelin and colicin
VEQDEESYDSLFDMLREEPQLEIRGSETNANITIRGRKPLHAPSEVLFAIDGILVGSYNNIYASIDINNVESIRVLSGPETSVYGPDGGSGVIVLRMKE